MIAVKRAELSATDAHAIIRPVSSDWEAVTAASRRLAKAAGPDLEAQCRALGSMPIGSAVVTPGGETGADFLIHVVVRSAEEPVTERGVRRGFDAALRRLVEWDVPSVAIAPLGIGAGNLDAEDAARIIVPMLAAHLRDQAAPERAEIVVETEYELDVFEAELRRVLGTTEPRVGEADR